MGLVRTGESQAQVLVDLEPYPVTELSTLHNVKSKVAAYAQSIGLTDHFSPAATIFHDNPCTVDSLPGEMVGTRRGTRCDRTVAPTPGAKYYVLFEPPGTLAMQPFFVRGRLPIFRN